MKNHLHKELTANVGAICMETPDDNPCAGSEIYVTLIFDKNQVQIAEKEISSCDKESVYQIGTFDWELKDGRGIVIDSALQKTQSIYEYAENLVLELRDKKIIGSITHLNGEVKEYVFQEVKN